MVTARVDAYFDATEFVLLRFIRGGVRQGVIMATRAIDLSEGALQVVGVVNRFAPGGMSHLFQGQSLLRVQAGVRGLGGGDTIWSALKAVACSDGRSRERLRIEAARIHRVHRHARLGEEDG